LDQHGDVHLQDTKARQVGPFKKARVFFGHLFEGWLVLYVIIIDAVKYGAFRRNGNRGVDEIAFAQYFAVGHYFDDRYLDNAIVGDICAGRLDIEKAYRIAEMKFHSRGFSADQAVTCFARSARSRPPKVPELIMSRF